MMQQLIEFVLSHPRAIPAVIMALMIGYFLRDPKGYLE